MESVIQLPETAAVAILTEAMRVFDRIFEDSGGSTRHYVMELLLPHLKKRGIVLAKIEQ